MSSSTPKQKYSESDDLHALAYNTEWNHFDSEQIKEFQCSICLECVKDPVFCDEGCLALCCRSCIIKTRISSRGKLCCPLCRKKQDHWKDAIDTRRKLKHLSVNCVFYPRCKWKGTFGCPDTQDPHTLFYHLKHHCGQIHVVCSALCDPLQMIPRKDLGHHLIYQCPKRRRSCLYCRQQLEASQMKSHLEHCSELQMTCPFRCSNAVFKRTELDLHYRSCKNALLPCPYECTSRLFTRAQLQTHEDEKKDLHLNQLAAERKSITQSLVPFYRQSCTSPSFVYRHDLSYDDDAPCFKLHLKPGPDCDAAFAGDLMDIRFCMKDDGSCLYLGGKVMSREPSDPSDPLNDSTDSTRSTYVFCHFDFNNHTCTKIWHDKWIQSIHSLNVADFGKKRLLVSTVVKDNALFLIVLNVSKQPVVQECEIKITLPETWNQIFYDSVILRPSTHSLLFPYTAGSSHYLNMYRLKPHDLKDDILDVKKIGTIVFDDMEHRCGPLQVDWHFLHLSPNESRAVVQCSHCKELVIFQWIEDSFDASVMVVQSIPMPCISRLTSKNISTLYWLNDDHFLFVLLGPIPTYTCVVMNLSGQVKYWDHRALNADGFVEKPTTYSVKVVFSKNRQKSAYIAQELGKNGTDAFLEAFLFHGTVREKDFFFLDHVCDQYERRLLCRPEKHLKRTIDYVVQNYDQQRRVRVKKEQRL